MKLIKILIICALITVIIFIVIQIIEIQKSNSQKVLNPPFNISRPK